MEKGGEEGRGVEQSGEALEKSGGGWRRLEEGGRLIALHALHLTPGVRGGVLQPGQTHLE